MDTIGRFLTYVSYPTMSVDASETCPSTEKQLALANHLTEELRLLGLTAFCDEHGYVYGKLPANTEKSAPKLGLIAHMDTSDACADEPISPKEILYDGTDVVLNEEKGIVLSEKEYPALAKYRGKHLITTDGTTLLGGDDKAGIAEILSALEDLIRSGKEHGTVSVAFTPDEEIGRGADLFDVPGFGADFAYTVDGGALGELEYENFNAASADIAVSGRSIHPGYAQGKMKNASLIAMELNTLLPDERPENTEGYEGFFHLTDIYGTCEYAHLSYIIRDHDRTRFEERKKTMENAVNTINERYGQGTAELSVCDSYYNMREIIEQHPETLRLARKAFREEGIEPVSVPIRGGTDGAMLSFKGLPCPNLSTGDEYPHSRFEFVCREDMETMTRVLVRLLTDAIK